MYRAGQLRPPPKCLGLSNGVRELMVLVPQADLGGAWQVRHNSLLKASAYRTGLDLAVYAGRRFPTSGMLSTLRRDPDIRLVRPLKVARLLYPGNADPEPGGWERLATLMHNDFHTDLQLTGVQLGAGRLGAGGYRVAHLTGTGTLTLTPADRGELAAFVRSGGTLVVDAAGGSREFAESAATELAATFPAAAAVPAGGGPPGATLAPGDPVYGVGGAAITSFAYRRYCRGRLSGKLNVPRVRGLSVDGRTAVFFSAEDLSAGLNGAGTDGILGYDPETATAIMRNLLLYAAAKP